jgi:hypothetical protein
MTPITNKTRANQAAPTDFHPRFCLEVSADGASMKIIVDKIDEYPRHALSKADIRLILSAVPLCGRCTSKLSGCLLRGLRLLWRCSLIRWTH